MKKLVLAAAAAMIFAPSLVTAQSSSIEKCGAGKRVTCVVDGDTIWFQGEKIRMMGYDTPEPTTDICGGFKEIDLANLATRRLVQLLSENPFTISRDGKDKYGRTLATIRIGEADVGEILIAEGLARAWPDGHEFWCD